jgi:hypothetical protein
MNDEGEKLRSLADAIDGSEVIFQMKVFSLSLSATTEMFGAFPQAIRFTCPTCSSVPSS